MAYGEAPERKTQKARIFQLLSLRISRKAPSLRDSGVTAWD